MSGAAGSRLPSQTSSLLVVPLFGGLLFFFLAGVGKTQGRRLSLQFKPQLPVSFSTLGS